MTMPPLVEVHWEDHYSIGDDWYPHNYQHEICILIAVGYLVAEDDLYWYVASTYEPSTRKYSAGTAVLKKCMTEFHYLERGKSKRRQKV